MNSTRVLSAALTLFLVGCCEPGSGDLVQETRSVRPFSRLVLDVPGNLRFTQGPSSPLKIRTDDNLIDDVITRVDGDTLVVETDSCCIDPTALDIQVSSEQIREVTIDGSGDIVLVGEIDADDLTLAIDGGGSISAGRVTARDVVLEIDGSGEIELEVDARTLDSTIDGSGYHRIAGTVTEHVLGIDGSGDVDAYGLTTATTRIDIDGSGGCEVTATDLLEVTVDGSGDISYCGDPRVVESIDGSGSVRREDGRCP